MDRSNNGELPKGIKKVGRGGRFVKKDMTKWHLIETSLGNSEKLEMRLEKGPGKHILTWGKEGTH